MVGYLFSEWVLSAIGLENPALVVIYTLFAGALIFVRFTERVSDFLDDFWQYEAFKSLQKSNFKKKVTI